MCWFKIIRQIVLSQAQRGWETCLHAMCFVSVGPFSAKLTQVQSITAHFSIMSTPVCTKSIRLKRVPVSYLMIVTMLNAECF